MLIPPIATIGNLVIFLLHLIKFFDAFFALGYAHAQDRFWQLNILRRSAQGRLSELFGQKTLDLDEFVRRLDIYNLSRLSLKYQSKQTIDILKAYSNGINARLKEINNFSQ